MMSRAWAMPSGATFTIKPIKSLLEKYVGDGKLWADPFAGNNSPAEFTNDLDPSTKAKDHELAKDWVRKLPSNLKGALFDPPYSYRQVMEHYTAIGRTVHQDDTGSYFYSSVKRLLAPKIEFGGLIICFGWNSTGMGKNLGFSLVEVLLVCHGGHNNDTIVTVEKRRT